MSDDLVERLLQDAAGLEQWDAYELGQAVPPALSYLGIAERIRTLTASLAQVTAERDHWLALAVVQHDVDGGFIYERDRASAAEADNAKLREALGPFANMLPDSQSTKDALQAKLQEWCRNARRALTTGATK